MATNAVLFKAKRINGVERLIGVGLQVLCGNNETSSWVRFNADGFACVLANGDFTVYPPGQASTVPPAPGLSPLATDLLNYIAERQSAEVAASLPNVVRYGRTHCAASQVDVFSAIAELYRAEQVWFDTSRAYFYVTP